MLIQIANDLPVPGIRYARPAISLQMLVFYLILLYHHML